jgi:carbamoyltransferase
MAIIWGINALNHDASIAVVNGTDIVFAGHSERYSRIKNDRHLNKQLVAAALEYGHPDELVWYESDWLKKSRYLRSGQFNRLFDCPVTELRSVGLGGIPVSFANHHWSHAAGGYYTSKFTDATVVVTDAIGEWDCSSIWSAEGSIMQKLASSAYPHSIGLLYTAFTQRVGLKPNEEEYILMGMAAYGYPVYADDIRKDFLSNSDGTNIKLLHNVHKGIKWWRPELTSEQELLDIAASIQQVTQEYMLTLIKQARELNNSTNLVLMGGVALNCVINATIANQRWFDDIWIMPNPGDAGSALGAVAARLSTHINWTTPYLGTNIDRPVDYAGIQNALLNQEIIGLANGRAEFGPRALGNRSLLADPRGWDIKDRMNDVKHRQRFRPFAPVILEKAAGEYFNMPLATSPYMQFTARCNDPDLFPAICHYDSTSRVQTVNRQQNPVLYTILRNFYKETGCPMLVNTSLNVKGEPLVDSWDDALQFSAKYSIKVF